MENYEEYETEREQAKQTSIGEDVVSWFGKALGLVKNYGAWTVIKTTSLITIIIMLAIVLHSVHQHDYIGTLIDKQTSELRANHYEAAKVRADITPKINNILTQLRYNINCDRVAIFEYHNGKSNPTDLPFMYADMTYENLTDGETYISDRYCNLSLSLYQLGYFISNKGYFQGSINQLMEVTPRFANRLEGDGIEFILIMSIHSSTEQIGYICATYREEPNLEAIDQFAYISCAAQDLQDLLDYKNNK